MNKCKAPILSCILTVLLCITTAYSLLQTKPDAKPDFVALSRLCDDMENENANPADVSCKYPFYVFDQNGILTDSSNGQEITLEYAAKNGYPIRNIYRDNRFYGTLVMEQNAELACAQYAKTIAHGVLFVTLVSVVNLVFLLLYLNHAILRPFRKLQNFAQSIANGNLDAPLSMDKKNVFGRFSESFDIMRLELKTARENEEAAVKAKQELISQLSHDIKTPLTSIKTSAELLAAKSDDPVVLKKTAIMIHKTNQIESLITDLFTDTLSALGNLNINMTEWASTELADLIKAADYRERISDLSIPDCVLRCDQIRLEQVFGNLIGNSYKYADTAITVSAQFSQRYLQVSVRDYGAGVDEEQLPHLCEQYYRADKEQKGSGAGLGLYIANNLMERMSGTLKLFSQDGFEAVVMIPLA